MNDPHFRYITKMGKRHLPCLGISCAVYSAEEYSERGVTYLSYYRPRAIVVVLQLREAD